MDLGIAGVHHIALIASDYGRSKDFYTRLLGCTIIAETWRAERQSWKLDLAIPGGGQLELFSFPGAPPRPTRPEAQGLRHLAFRVAAIEPARAALQAAGVEVEDIRPDPVAGGRFCFFADPDGLPLELVEAPRTLSATMHPMEESN